MRGTWAGHVDKMGAEKLPKSAAAQKVERKWRRGRPKLPCVISLNVTQKEREKNGKKS